MSLCGTMGQAIMNGQMGTHSVRPLGQPSRDILLDIPEGVCQFGSFEKQMPRWNETCKRFLGGHVYE